MASAPQSWSSVAKKVVLAITGLAMALFLVGHLTGNTLILLPDGGQTFNAYGHALVSNPLVYVVEAGLIVLFLLHVYQAVTNNFANKAARPERYYAQQWAGGKSRKSLASTWMIVSGLVVAIFVPLHVAAFKFDVFGKEQPAIDGVRQLSALVRDTFVQPVWVLWYLAALLLLFAHLWHGVSSAFQSLGANHPKYNRWILRLGWAFAIVIGGGFVALPLIIFLRIL